MPFWSQVSVSQSCGSGIRETTSEDYDTAANNDLNVIINITILYYCVWKKSRKGSLSEKLCDTILTKICCSSFVYCN